MPQIGEEITVGSYHFEIQEATNKKIELVKLTVKE
ncbi:MAG: transporter associated domain-containing protein [Flavobacterium sp.]|nr:transporter associated domain-containing protein [Flavobacterium sp.]